METTFNQRALIHSLGQFIDQEVLLRGWVYRLRVLAKTTFIIIKDCSGEAQCVTGSDLLKDLHLKLDDCVEIYGQVRADHRSRSGYEVDVIRVRVLSRSATGLPFNSSSKVESVGPPLHGDHNLKDSGFRDRRRNESLRAEIFRPRGLSCAKSTVLQGTWSRGLRASL